MSPFYVYNWSMNFTRTANFNFFSPPKDEDGNAQPPSADILWASTAAAVTGAYLATQKKKKHKIGFESEKKEAKAQTETTNISWGAAATAAIGIFNAKIEERKRKEREERERAHRRRMSDHGKRRAAEKAGTLGAYIREKRSAKAADEKAEVERIRRKDQKKKDKKQREKSGLSDKEWKKKQERQAIWDANGAAIYEANKAFETEHGHKMDSASREKAIAEATVGGVFNAGLYSVGLKEAQEEKEAERVAAQQALHEKSFDHKESLLELSDLPETDDKTQALADWKEGDMTAADEYIQNTPSSGWAWGKTIYGWGESYVSQGDQTNNCGPANLTIVFNALTATTWDMTMVSPSRLGPIAGDGEGATPPWSFVKEFNRLAAENGIDTIATRRVNATKEDLINELNNGNPVTIIRNFTSEVEGGSHYQTVIAYDADTDMVYLMDPGYMYEYSTDVIKQVREQPWTEFEEDWSKPLKKTADGGDIDISTSITLLQPNQMITYR